MIRAAQVRFKDVILKNIKYHKVIHIFDRYLSYINFKNQLYLT